MIPMQEVPCKGPSPPKIGYVLKRFPRISETFILNEVLELEQHGIPIEIFTLLEPAEEVTHEALKRVQAKVTYLPKDSSLKKWQIREGRYAGGTFRKRSSCEPGPFWSRRPSKPKCRIAKV